LHLSNGIIYCRVSCWTYYTIYEDVTGGMSNHYHSTEVLMDWPGRETNGMKFKMRNGCWTADNGVGLFLLTSPSDRRSQRQWVGQEGETEVEESTAGTKKTELKAMTRAECTKYKDTA
jgi:hypothetical protein